MEMREHDFEPIRGLPGQLPEGERILWQGAPSWRSFALRVFHLRLIALYTVVMSAWTIATHLYDGESIASALLATLGLIVMMGIAAGLLAGFAWMIERTTVYTLTNRRLVLRVGVALPITLNLPFTIVESAELKVFPDGTGNIPLTLNGEDKVAVIHIWPHARPWHFKNPQPMLRCIPDAEAVAGRIADALTTARAITGVAKTSPDTSGDKRPEESRPTEADGVGSPAMA